MKMFYLPELLVLMTTSQKFQLNLLTILQHQNSANLNNFSFDIKSSKYRK